MTYIQPNYLVGAVIAVGCAILSLYYIKRQQSENIYYPRKDVKDFANKVLGKKVNDEYPLKGLTAIVTGSTSGLGREIAGELYNLGAHVVIASRNKAKCELTIEDIKKEHPSSQGSLEIGVIDTSDFDSVKKFADSFKSTHSELHFLVNNAGIHYLGSGGEGMLALMQFSKDHISKQGYDMAFATNYMGHFLLTKYLIEMIDSSAAKLSDPSSSSPKFYGRVLNVASAYHLQVDGTMLRPNGTNPPLAARSDIQSFQHKIVSYGNNKLAQILHAKELQRRIDSSALGLIKHIKVISACPGWTKTPILPNNPTGHFIAANAFPANAAAVGSMMALLDPSLSGGEFITNYVDISSRIPGLRSFLGLLSNIHGSLRSYAVMGLSLVLLFTQSSGFGYHIERSSEESFNEELAASLYDWTDAELTKKGY